MSEQTVWTEEKISIAVSELKRIRPVYAEILNFYERLFMTQVRYEAKLNIDPIILTPDSLDLKADQFFPLIHVDEFIVHLQELKILLEEVCQIAKQTNESLKKTAGIIISSLKYGEIDADILFKALIEGNHKLIEDSATRLGILKDQLAFIVYNSIRPAVISSSLQLSHYLEEIRVWDKGYCRICGSVPALALLDEEGRRFLVCSFCWHEWPVPRILCPFCENKESSLLRYFFCEEEKEYRVNVCDKCGKFIKTVDKRETNRSVYPPLEQVATLHLDIKAKELGHISGI